MLSKLPLEIIEKILKDFTVGDAKELIFVNTGWRRAMNYYLKSRVDYFFHRIDPADFLNSEVIIERAQIFIFKESQIADYCKILKHCQNIKFAVVWVADFTQLKEILNHLGKSVKTLKICIRESKDSAKEIPTFNPMPTVEELHLTGLSKDFRNLSKVFTNLKILEVHQTSGDDVDAFQAFSSIIDSNKKLEKVYMCESLSKTKDWNFIKNVGEVDFTDITVDFGTMPQVVKDNPKKFSCLVVDASKTKDLNFIADNFQHIETVEIRAARIHSPSHLYKIYQKIVHNKNLRQLVIKYLALHNFCFIHKGLLNKPITAITSLSIKVAEMDDNMLAVIAKNTPNIECLHLSFNFMAYEFKPTFLRIVGKHWKKLKWLRIEELSDDNGFIKETFNVNCTPPLLNLESLHLESTCMTHPQEFFQHLKAPKLTKLTYNVHPKEHTSDEVFIFVRSACPNIQTLEVDNANFSESAILSIFKDFPDLKRATLEGSFGLSFESIGKIIRTHKKLKFLDIPRLSNLKDAKDCIQKLNCGSRNLRIVKNHSKEMTVLAVKGDNINVNIRLPTPLSNSFHFMRPLVDEEKIGDEDPMLYEARVVEEFRNLAVFKCNECHDQYNVPHSIPEFFHLDKERPLLMEGRLSIHTMEGDMIRNEHLGLNRMNNMLRHLGVNF